MTSSMISIARSRNTGEAEVVCERHSLTVATFLVGMAGAQSLQKLAALVSRRRGCAVGEGKVSGSKYIGGDDV